MIITHFVFTIKVKSLILIDVSLCWGIGPRLKPMINLNSSSPNLNPFEFTKNHISSFFFIRHWRNNRGCTIWAENLSFGISKKYLKQESLNLSNCSLLSFFLIFSIILRCDRHAAFDGKCSFIGILTLKHVEGVVVYKLNKIKLVKI